MPTYGLLLAHPKPIHGESMFSYILRLAEKNELSILQLLNLLRHGERYVQTEQLRNMDLFPDAWINIKELSRLCGQEVQKLEDCTLVRLYRKFADTGDVSRVRFLSGLIRDEFAYCPACLNEFQYLPLLWRFNQVEVCLSHNCYLLHECLNCHRVIQYRDISEIGKCPYCHENLLLAEKDTSPLGREGLEQQSWLIARLTELIHDVGEPTIVATDLAMKVLYVLSDCNSPFRRELVEQRLPEPGLLPTLLQHARGTLSQTRTLHLHFLLDILYDFKLTFRQFFELTVPQTFSDSVCCPTLKRTEQYCCMAPWCEGYKQPGTLVKTGTTVKQRKSGEKLLYYMVCTSCGCEYAVSPGERLQERTYFVKFYMGLLDNPYSTPQQVATKLELSTEILRRCTAYFSTRRHTYTDWFTESRIESYLLRKFITAIENRDTLKTIRVWDCWESYQHFLLYRYHLEVMLAINNLVRPRQKRVLDLEAGRIRVQGAVREMLDTNVPITIKKVSEMVGRSPETLRAWDCNQIIAKGKLLQERRRIERLKRDVITKVISFLINHEGSRVRPNEVYKQLGRARSSLWRIDPTLTAEIRERIDKHNNGLRLEDQLR